MKMMIALIALAGFTSCQTMHGLSTPSKALYTLGKAMSARDTNKIKSITYDMDCYQRLMKESKYLKNPNSGQGFINAYKLKHLKEYIDDDFSQVTLTVTSSNPKVSGLVTLYSLHKVEGRWKYIGWFNEH